MSEQKRIVALERFESSPAAAIRNALSAAGILDRIKKGSRVAIKPNLTYPYHKRGVTTTPRVLEDTVRILLEYTDKIAIVETDGGYGAWNVKQAFEEHGVYRLAEELKIEAVNLIEEPREIIKFRSGWRQCEIPVPTRLLRNTDVFITMPVPKIHCMTGISLAYKNQWGCVPDIMRLRRHYIFNEAIVAINMALKPAVLGDGTWFLNNNGPMAGDPVAMNVIIAASDAGGFDRYVSDLMGYSWKRVPHLRRAVKQGDMPADLNEIRFNIPPREAGVDPFVLHRSFRNYIALVGFRSRFITWLGYESWFGRVILHAILYAIYGKPVKPKPGDSNPKEEVRLNIP